MVGAHQVYYGVEDVNLYAKHSFGQTKYSLRQFVVKLKPMPKNCLTGDNTKRVILLPICYNCIEHRQYREAFRGLLYCNGRRLVLAIERHMARMIVAILCKLQVSYLVVWQGHDLQSVLLTWFLAVADISFRLGPRILPAVYMYLSTMYRRVCCVREHACMVAYMYFRYVHKYVVAYAYSYYVCVCICTYACVHVASHRDVKRKLRMVHKTFLELLPIDLGTDC